MHNARSRSSGTVSHRPPIRRCRPTRGRSALSTASRREMSAPPIHHAAVFCTIPTIARPQIAAGAGSSPRSTSPSRQRLGDPLGDAVGERRRHLVAAPGVAVDDEAVQLRISARCSRRRRRSSPGSSAAAGPTSRLASLRVEDLADLHEGLLGDRRDEAVAVDEVAVEDRLADPAGGRHLLHRHVGALAPDHVDRRVEQFAAAQLASLGSATAGTRGPAGVSSWEALNHGTYRRSA